MTTHYQPKTFLRQTSNKLLQACFSQMDALAEIPWSDLSEHQIDVIYDGWQTLPDSQRSELERMFEDADALSNEEGLKAIVDEGTFHGRDLATELAPLEDYHDKAMYVAINYPRIFEVAGTINRAHSLSRRYWKHRGNMPLVQPDVTVEGIQRFSDAISIYFRQNEGRGHRCTVDAYLRVNRYHYFFAYPDNYADTYMGHNEQGGFIRRPQRPTFEIIFLFDPVEGTLDVYAQGGKSVQEALQTIFCRILLSQELPAESLLEHPYELNVLKPKDFADVSEQTDPVDGIEQIQIRKLRLSILGQSKRRITLEADPESGPTEIYKMIEECLNRENVAAVAKSLKEFGWRQPIVVDADMTIVCGHTRWKAAQQLGLTQVPIHVARDLTPTQLRAYRLADNATSEIATWDPKLLPVELGELEELNFDLSVLGFGQEDLAKHRGHELEEGLVDPDDVPLPPDEAITQPGDLWILGDHRLLCSDSSNPADVDRLLAGQPIHLVNTDPPYNVKVEPRSKNAIAAGLSSFPAASAKGNSDARGPHDQGFDLGRNTTHAKGTTKKLRARDRPLANDFVSDEAFDQLLDSWFGNIARVLLPGRCLYCWGGYANCANYPPVLKRHGLYFSQAIIWVKQHAVLTRKDFMGNHEWCFYSWKEGAGHKFYGPNNAQDVWEIAQTTVSNDLKAIQKAWRDSAVRDFDLCREVELQKIDRVEREAWSAWERSQKPAQSARFQEGADAGRSDKTVRNQHGDTRFLELVIKCSSERRVLLRLNLETPVVQNNVSIQLTHDEREQHITALLLELQGKLPAPQSEVPSDERKPPTAADP